MEKHEFASPQWFRVLRATMERLAREAGPDFAEARWSACEVFTDAPAHLSPTAERRIAWHCRIEGGSIDFDLGEIDAADFKIVADYQTILPLARLHLGEDPAVRERVNETLMKGVMEGKIQVQGSPDTRPAAFATLHDEMVRVTA